MRRRFIAIAAAFIAVATACSGAADGAADPTAPDHGVEHRSDVEPLDPYPEHRLTGVWGEDVAMCMTELGWDVSAHDDGGISGQFAEGQLEIYNEDRSRCEIATGHDPDQYASVEYLEKAFENLAEVAGCIQELGYTISESPSKQAWIEWAQQQAQDPQPYVMWNPHGEVADANGSAALAHALAECPVAEAWEIAQWVDADADESS
jgi:hypothetical protein